MHCFGTYRGWRWGAVGFGICELPLLAADWLVPPPTSISAAAEGQRRQRLGALQLGALANGVAHIDARPWLSIKNHAHEGAVAQSGGPAPCSLALPEELVCLRVAL